MAGVEIGELLEGKYRIERVIGEGAWGEVLEATNVRIKRRVAIKVLKAQYASNQAMVSRFEREALASTHIESPHVVQIFDAGVLADGRPYMVMEFLVGEDVGKLIEKAKGSKLPLTPVVGFCIQAARGLSAAHAAGIFHRDVKPSNIVIAQTKSGREVAKIVDFGISKLLNDRDAVSTTQTGTIMGSPVYMSPEQARGAKTIDQRSDIYSLGVVLYECATGRTPFIADTFNELLFKIALEEPLSPKALRDDIDDALAAIIMKAMARAPEDRFQTAAELEAVLVDWLQKNADGSEWLDASGRVNLHASPTRGQSIPDMLVASPVAGESRVLAQSASQKAPQEPTGQSTLPLKQSARDTGTGLSKTQDPTLTPAPPPAASKRTALYVGAAAIALLVGLVGAATMRSSPTTTVAKPEPTAPATAPAVSTAPPSATSLAVAAPTVEPKPLETATATAAPDAGAPKPAVTHATTTAAPKATATTTAAPKPTATATGTSVGGRTIRTDF